MHVDPLTRDEFKALNEQRADACVSIYVETSPHSQHAKASQTQLGNLAKTARAQLEAAGLDKRRIASLAEQIEELIEDEPFWRLQGNSLAVLATPDSLRTYRLADGLEPMVMVADRFHLKPLLRTLAFPGAAFVLAISEEDVRLLEVFPDHPPVKVKVTDLPRDAASYAGQATLNDRSAKRRVHGTEGQNMRLRQYARAVDAALRPVLAGRETPLVLAAADRMTSLYRSVNSYPHLVPETIADATDRTSEGELAEKARPVLEAVFARQVAAFAERYEQRGAEQRTTGDLSDAARAATYGAIERMLVDIDRRVPGALDEGTGALTLADEPSAATYDVVDEIAGRALATGAHVLGVRSEQVPGGGALAAILRYPV